MENKAFKDLICPQRLAFSKLYVCVSGQVPTELLRPLNAFLSFLHTPTHTPNERFKAQDCVAVSFQVKDTVWHFPQRISRFLPACCHQGVLPQEATETCCFWKLRKSRSPKCTQTSSELLNESSILYHFNFTISNCNRDEMQVGVR